MTAAAVMAVTCCSQNMHAALYSCFAPALHPSWLLGTLVVCHARAGSGRNQLVRQLRQQPLRDFSGDAARAACRMMEQEFSQSKGKGGSGLWGYISGAPS